MTQYKEKYTILINQEPEQQPEFTEIIHIEPKYLIVLKKRAKDVHRTYIAIEPALKVVLRGSLLLSVIGVLGLGFVWVLCQVYIAAMSAIAATDWIAVGQFFKWSFVGVCSVVVLVLVGILVKNSRSSRTDVGCNTGYTEEYYHRTEIIYHKKYHK